MLQIPDSFKSEADMQAFIFQYFWNNHPDTRRLIFHVPNGGSRNKIEAVRLRAQGVVKGIPDLMALTPKGAIGIELKVSGGIVSDDQHKVHAVWNAHGFPVYICWSAEEAITTIATHMGISVQVGVNFNMKEAV